MVRAWILARLGQPLPPFPFLPGPSKTESGLPEPPPPVGGGTSIVGGLPEGWFVRAWIFAPPCVRGRLGAANTVVAVATKVISWATLEKCMMIYL